MTTLASDRRRLLRGVVLPVLAAVVPLAIAIVGAFMAGVGTAGIVGSVESWAGASSRLIQNDIGSLLPLGYAFGAGMVATVNPCGFAMLPAYLALYLGADSQAETQTPVAKRLGKALLVGVVVTAGFVLLFGGVGGIISAGAQSIKFAIPWIGLVIGVLLAFAGAWLLSGGKLYSGIAARAASHMGDPSSVSIKGYFLFGLSYATASLSCTLPIFLAVIGTSLSTGGFWSAVGQFIVYALGMGTVIMALTLAVALFRGAMVGALRKVLPYTQPLSAAFMILAGAYIVFYWLTAGGLVDKF